MPTPQEDRAKALRVLELVSTEIRVAFNKWDEYIKAGQMPVPIQDLDYWADQISRARIILEGD